MTRINKQFFQIAQASAKYGVILTTKHAGEFDWNIGMMYLKMAYGYASIEEIEKYVEALKIFND